MGTPFVKFLRDYFSRKCRSVWGKTLRRFLKTPRRFFISLRIKNIFKFTIPLHSLHRYHNWLIYKISPCNDKEKYHITDVTFISEWHQWHEKNKHITRGNIDIQRFIVFVLWVQWNNGSKFFLNNSQLYSENIYLWRNNILIRALHCKKENVYLQCPAGEMAGHIRKRFLLYPNIEIANFKAKG